MFDAFGLGSYAGRMLAKVPAMILCETHPAGLRAGDGAQEEDALVADHFRADRRSAPKQTGRLVRPYLRWGNSMIALEQRPRRPHRARLMSISKSANGR